MMKSYTDIVQSKKLQEILPIESADMWWPYYYDVLSDSGEYDKEPILHKPIIDIDHAIPCWSLAALLEVLPEEIIDDNGYNIVINIEKHQISYFTDLNFSDKIRTNECENLIDACVEMILKLHEKNLL